MAGQVQLGLELLATVQLREVRMMLPQLGS